MDIITLALAKKYTNSVALNGVPVQIPQIDPVTKNWLVFNPVTNAWIDTGISAEGRAPEIGANGNWWIGGADTGHPVRGVNGETPEIRVENRVLQTRFPSWPVGVWADLYELPDTETYEHVQNIATAIWTIPHNLGRQFVGVRVNDFAGNDLLPDVEYTSANIVTLSFANAVQGIAQINL